MDTVLDRLWDKGIPVPASVVELINVIEGNLEACISPRETCDIIFYKDTKVAGRAFEYARKYKNGSGLLDVDLRKDVLALVALDYKLMAKKYNK